MSLTANLWSTLNDRKAELEKTICKATKILKRPVQGHLEVNKRGNKRTWERSAQFRKMANGQTSDERLGSQLPPLG